MSQRRPPNPTSLANLRRGTHPSQREMEQLTIKANRIAGQPSDRVREKCTEAFERRIGVLEIIIDQYVVSTTMSRSQIEAMGNRPPTAKEAISAMDTLGRYAGLIPKIEMTMHNVNETVFRWSPEELQRFTDAMLASRKARGLPDA